MNWRQRHKKRDSENGAILITVMLTVAVMAAVAVVILDRIRFSVSITLNGEQASQAQWIALGLEDWAQDTLEEWQRMASAEDPIQPPSDAAARLSVDTLSVAATLAPLPNCFNLNSLVAKDDEGNMRTDEAAKENFVRLLTALDMSSFKAVHLAAAVADWVDPDSEMQPSGAEDYEYSGLGIPYRTGNVPLADVSELRAIKGFSREVYLQVRPHVCALPHNEANTINLNMLSRADAPLIATIFDESPMRSALDMILAARPPEGFSETETLLTDPDLKALIRDGKGQELLALDNRFFILRAEITGADTFTTMHTFFDSQAENGPGIIRRSFGDQT